MKHFWFYVANSELLAQLMPPAIYIDKRIMEQTFCSEERWIIRPLISEGYIRPSTTY